MLVSYAEERPLNWIAKVASFISFYLMTTITLRNAAHDDSDALLAVHLEAIRVLGRGAYSEGECKSWAHGLTPAGYSRAMHAGERFVVAVVADTVVAFCSYSGQEVLGLFVHPKWSRRGIASRLLAAVEERIFARGSKLIVLDAAASAVPFYIAAGYTLVCQMPWMTRGGLSLSSYRMVKDC